MSVELENELRSRPLRTAPTAWRSEILAACRAAQKSESPPLALPFEPPSSTQHQLAPRRRHFFSLWPNPAAWASLAAIWVGLLFVNRQVTDPPPDSPTTPPPAGYWAHQREELAKVQMEIAALEASMVKRVPKSESTEPELEPTLPLPLHFREAEVLP